MTGRDDSGQDRRWFWFALGFGTCAVLFPVVERLTRSPPATPVAAERFVTRTPPAAAPGCSPPYRVDDAGNKHWRPECFPVHPSPSASTPVRDRD